MTRILNLFLGVCRLLTIFWVSSGFAHDTPTAFVVDTDMGLDDVRAITLLLHSPDCRVAGIVVTEGASDVDTAEKNAKRLLAHFDSSQIPVVRGVDLKLPVPPWREHSNAMGWVHERIELPPAREAARQPTDLNELIRGLGEENLFPGSRRQKIHYVCLGPLSTLARALEDNPQLPQHISRVYFSGTGPSLEPSWNRSCDPGAFDTVLKQSWEFVAFGRPDSELPAVSADFIEKLANIDSPSARFIAALHQAPHVDRLVRQGHLKFWDDPVALYLNRPELGEIHEVSGQDQIYQLTAWDSDKAESAYFELVSSSAHKL